MLILSPSRVCIQAMANELVSNGGGDIIRGNIMWSSFPDGFPNLKIQDVDLIKNNKVS